MQKFPTRALLALAAALVLWASAFAGIRAGLRAYSPGQLAVLRFVVASLVLALYAGIAHFRRLQARDLPGFALNGIIGITFYNLALNYGETRVSAGAASLLIASVPIWTALLASFTLHERLAPRRWIGVFVSFAGVALIASGESIELDLFITDHTGRNFYLAMLEHRALPLLSLEPLQDGHIGVVNRIGIVIPFGLPDVGPAVRVVELLHRVEL